MRLKLIFFCSILHTLIIAQTCVEVHYYAPLQDANGNYSAASTDYTLISHSQRSIFTKQAKGNSRDLDLQTKKLAMNFSGGAYWLYKDFKAEQLSNYVSSIREQNYLVQDHLHPCQWEIMEEKKTISNIPVQKARGNYRGRSYTAWFAPSIPISNGPWKLGGLPGLILEAYDDEKLVVFLFRSLRYLPFQTISPPKNKAGKISLKAYYELNAKEVKQYYEFLNARMKKDGLNVSIATGEFSPWEYVE